MSPAAGAIPVDDWAFRYGWGAFDTIRIHQGCPLFYERHVNRLCAAAIVLELGNGSSEESQSWSQDVKRAVRLSRMNVGLVNCYWTKGSTISRIKPSRIVRVRPLPRYPRRPLSLWLAPWRLEPTYPGTGVKTLAYFPYIFAGLGARREGHDDAIILNTHGRIADGAASSIFAVFNSTVITPRLSDGALAGITRGIAIELLRERGYVVKETTLPWSRLLEADSVFVTSALRGIVEVQAIPPYWRKPRSRSKKLLSAVTKAYALRISKDIRQYRLLP